MTERARGFEPDSDLRQESGAWRDRAACLDKDQAPWFPGPYDTFMARVAIRVCKHCPVQSDCLAEALSWPAKDDIGIWGGTTQAQRAKMRSQNGSR